MWAGFPFRAGRITSAIALFQTRAATRVSAGREWEEMDGVMF
jgi:hypothetical protein